LFVANAVKGDRPTHNKAGSVSIPPDPAIDGINPAKNATATSIDWINKLKSTKNFL